MVLVAVVLASLLSYDDPARLQFLLSCLFKRLTTLFLLVPRPSRDHTEIEEELHEKANIDYDRVAIVGRRLFLDTPLRHRHALSTLPNRPPLCRHAEPLAVAFRPTKCLLLTPWLADS